MSASSPLMSEILQQKKFIKFDVPCLCDMYQSLFIQLQHRTLVISKPTECVNGPGVSCIIIIIIIIIIYTCMRGVFTIVYLKHTMFIGYIILHLFCG
jgi:hypothetical protein